MMNEISTFVVETESVLLIFPLSSFSLVARQGTAVDTKTEQEVRGLKTIVLAWMSD